MSRVADVAVKAVTDPRFPSEPGWCQKFIRLVVTEALGSKWGEMTRTNSAKNSAIKLMKLGYAQPYKGGVIQPGDILYKTQGSGGFGHVGIAVRVNGKLMVAENSSYHAARSKSGDARGFRTLEQFGPFQVLARLPEPKQATQAPAATQKPAPDTSIIISKSDGAKWHSKRIKTILRDGENFAPVRDVLTAAGVKYEVAEWEDETPLFVVPKV